MRLFQNSIVNALVWGLLVIVLGGGAAGLGVVTVIFGMVYFGDDSHLKKSVIMARINEETTIYCLDEQTPIGSFFNSEHRRYITIDEVPDSMINAIIAAEDKNFYHHHGVDPSAIMKAMAEGFQTGRFRGGSTLTQQTVKNILDRWEYSLRRKINEAIAALQLERLYTKKQILEFYLNQFHVSGNGSGVGIAAKYYFNKEVRDLDLVEAAFIAGSVKGPSKYDPFLKYTKERREIAVKNAFQRKNYVLRRMYEQGWIKEDEFKEAFAKPVPFNRGSFRSAEVALVSLIRQQVSQKEVLDVLQLESQDELNRSGLKIFTSIDCRLQEGAQLAMRRNLSRLETILGGYQAENPESFRRLRDLTVNQFYYGKVDEVKRDPSNAEVRVSFGLSVGTIPQESLVRYAKLMDLPFQEGYQVQLKKLLQQIHVGDILFVEVNSYDSDKHEAVLEMHRNPKVSGGIVALDKGEVRIAVSGFDTLGFNRAIFARRQPGSVFKSVVYFAALSLGWNILDIIDNERQVFPYQGHLYFPRPDHVSPYRNVSMVWAGTMSENLASVALANRLVEKLNLEQFKQLMGTMGLLPTQGESAPDFHFRVARALGVQLDNDGVKEFQLDNAVADVAPDVVFGGQQEALRAMEKMWWGRGYQNELHNLFTKKAADMPPLENATRVNLVKNNFLRLKSLSEKLEMEWNLLSMRVQEKGPEVALRDPGLVALWDHFRVLPTTGSKPALGFFAVLEGEGAITTSERYQYIDRLATVQGRPLNPFDLQAIFSQNVLDKSEVRLNGTIPFHIFKKLEGAVDERYRLLMAQQSPYDLNRYYQHHDFRIALGLNYLVKLVESMGVSSKIEPVQSFPLGTNDVTAAEVAKIYQTMITGKTYKFYEKGPQNQVTFIRRIEDRAGNKVYEPKRLESNVIIPEFTYEMREILRRVVTHGTGRRARGELYVTLDGTEGGKDEKRIRVPAFGKTGTTNDYTNAYFAGFFPYPVAKGKPLEFDNSYTIASYVGYDLNKMMRRGAIKISGALGALPVWTDFAKNMIETLKYKDYVDPLDLDVVRSGEWTMRYDAKNSQVNVDLPRGAVVGAGEAQEEAFATTNLAKTGESFENEFAVGSMVRTVVRVPLDGSQVARFFSPYRFTAESVLGGEPASTKISVSEGAGHLPIDQATPAAPNTGGAGSVLPGAKESEIQAAPLDILDDEGRVITGGKPPAPDGGAAPSEGMTPNLDEGKPAAAPGAPANGAPEKKPGDKDGFIEEDLW